MAEEIIQLNYFNSRAHVERDIIIQDSKSILLNFNSRAHVERDLSALRLTLAWAISTHALTWSATGGRRIYTDRQGFQLTRSRGARRENTIK